MGSFTLHDVIDARTLRVPVRRSGFSASLRLSHELLLIECLLVLQHVIHCSAEFMGKNTKRFALAMLLRQPIEIFLDRFITPKENDGCFREGPLEMGVADLVSSVTILLTV